MEPQKLSMEYVPISELKPAPYNPRRLSAAEFNKLKGSLQQFGWAEPVVVNQRSGNIVGGHMRVQAAMALGMTEAPVVYVDVDDKAERALNLALNKISGEWDEDLLTEILVGLDDMLEVSGFDQGELDALLADPFDDEEAAGTDEPETKKEARYTVEQLRTLAQSYHPAGARKVLEFLKWLETRESDAA